MQLAHLLQIGATAACASSGALSAGRRNLDLVGVLVISFCAAVGGGTLRDLLLDRNPVFWLEDNTYLFASILAGLLTWAYAHRWPPPYRLLLTVDAAGLALFTITGTQIAEQTGHGVVACVMMGVITGVAGGVLRDILCGEIPLTFRRGELYASAAVAGGGCYVMLRKALPSPAIPIAVGAALIFSLRMGALKWGWRLPIFEFHDRSSSK